MLTLGPFELHEVLARGGMGEVWRGLHRDQGVQVAIKLLLDACATDPSRVAAFHDEARAAASLDHPSIVLLFDYGEVPPEVARDSGGRIAAGRPWLAMEYARGRARPA